ncbi:MAG: hypothetical protein IJG40_05985 [Oscillospiraceae bacterium]|nr:hypothetical protein [Oscillospiraceae bacterium]
MKKALSIILTLIFVLSFCGNAFAANNNLRMTFNTEVVNGVRVNNFQYRDTEGRLIREETDTLGSKGQLIEKQVSIYNEAGQKVSERIGTLEDSGVWKDDESVWTYNSDGSEVVDSRVVFTYPDMRQEFNYMQITVDAEGKSTGRGEGRDVYGNKLYDLSFEYRDSDDERTDIVKYSYPDGTISTEYHSVLNDGTVINGTVKENAAGQIINEKTFQQNPDGSYDRTSTTNTYMDNGKKFSSQTNESMDANGNRGKESVSYTLDGNGFGSGSGVREKADGTRSIITVEYRNDEEEGNVCATTYKNSDGTIDLKYVVTAPDGETKTTYERDIKNYDGDDDSENFDEAFVEDEADPFDAWDAVFDDWYEGELYIGDPTALDSGDTYDYYETEVGWSDGSDWGDASDWSPDWDDYGNGGGWDGSWDDASGWVDASGWDDASGWE